MMKKPVAYYNTKDRFDAVLACLTNCHRLTVSFYAARLAYETLRLNQGDTGNSGGGGGWVSEPLKVKKKSNKSIFISP